MVGEEAVEPVLVRPGAMRQLLRIMEIPDSEEPELFPAEMAAPGGPLGRAEPLARLGAAAAEGAVTLAEMLLRAAGVKLDLA